MVQRIAIILLLIASLLAGCAAATASAPNMSPEYYSPGAKTLDGGAGAAQSMDAYSPVANQAADATNANRLILKNASISLYVDDPTASAQRLRKMAEEMGGFVVSSNVVQTQLSSGVQVPHASVTIRVPSERLDEAMAAIRAETSLPVISENISSQDVTGEYIDLQSRLRNLEAKEAQLQKIMDSASAVEDVLAVYNQLTATRQEIELIKGQMKYYEESAALSVINADLTANAAEQPLTVAGWQPVGVAKDALQALIKTLQVLGSALIIISVYFIPLALIILGPILLVVWLGRRALRRRKNTPSAK